MLGDDALEFLKRMYKLDKIWKNDGEAEYSERQLVQFAERYHNYKLEKWNENVEVCDGCGIKWKKIGQPCKVCYYNKQHKKK